MEVLHLRGLVHVAEASAGGEGDRSRASQNFRRVIKEDFVDDVGGERGPIHRRSAFDHHAGDLEFSEAAENGRQVWATVRSERRDLLDANPELFELGFLLRIGRCAEDENIIFAIRGNVLYQARVNGQAQARVENHAKQRTATSATAGLSRLAPLAIQGRGRCQRKECRCGKRVRLFA